MAMHIGHSVRQYEKEMIHHLRQLIQIHSVMEEPKPGMPYGEGVNRALHYMLDLASELGFRTAHVNGYTGHAEFGSGDEIAAVVTHVDTVPIGDGWTYPPLSAEIVDGKIYGRGASDNKFAVIAALYSLYALKQAGFIPDRRIRVIFGTNEENGMNDLDYYFEQEPLPDYAFVTDGGYPISNAEKGVITFSWIQKLEASASANWIRIEGGDAANVVPDLCCAEVLAVDGKQLLALEKTGKASHGAWPHNGINAITRLIEEITSNPLCSGLTAEPFLQFMQQRVGKELDGTSLGIAFEEEIHGSVTVNLASIAVNREEAKVTLNIRYPVSAKGDEIISLLTKIAADAGLETVVKAHMPALYMAPDHPLIGMLSRAYETVTGDPARLISMAGGTYAKKLRNRGVTFGPSFPGSPATNFHQTDENIGIDQLMRHAEVCTQALYELSKK
ncbi:MULTISPECIES: Sapep family Mn(2+)-dependent dipeptidase [unclassified Paenibacillus]|uniref:Sapep family Mn(2+)-dependent dipeptidase n=1 Tax=unclassified Paenibacillus TaxID=185978 RepID=UPI003632839E